MQKHDKLLRMANQIAQAIAARPAAEQADTLSSHINDYWAPTMRAVLLRKIAEGEPGLHPLLLQVASRIRPQPAD